MIINEVMPAHGEGAPALPSGSRPSDQAQLHGPDASRFDPSRRAHLLASTGLTGSGIVIDDSHIRKPIIRGFGK